MNFGYEAKTIKQPEFTAQLFFDYSNERLLVNDFSGNIDDLLRAISKYVEKYSFTKIIIKTRPQHWQELLSKGLELEAIFKSYFNGIDCYAMAFYKETKRRTSHYWVQENDILISVLEKDRKSDLATPPSTYHFRRATKEDVVQLSSLYDHIFKLYPTPMNQPEYIHYQMNSGNIFYLVEHNKQIVSAASADINKTFNHAELTDCATLPEHRKYGLMKKILSFLEADLKQQGITCVFSIARALSYGMNAALYQLGYEYGGRMINNCYIFDKMEDMNVWTKDLSV